MDKDFYAEQEEKILKKWEESTIQNNFVFGKTMEMNPKLCKQLIEYILEIEIDEITFPEREKTIENRIDSKGVRLDVYVKDNKQRVFDLEMQISNTSDNLAKRMRYYQGALDGDALKRSQHYTSLNPTYIIFICPFDLFDLGRRIYTFRERCDEKTSLVLPSETTKIILNTKGTIGEVNENLKGFLDYVEKGVINTDFIGEMDKAVEIVKFDRKARSEYMGYEMDLLEREIKGRKEMQIMMNKIISEKDTEIAEKNTKIAEKDTEIAMLRRELERLRKC